VDLDETDIHPAQGRRDEQQLEKRHTSTQYHTPNNLDTSTGTHRKPPLSEAASPSTARLEPLQIAQHSSYLMLGGMGMTPPG
jgi:hypothetical protein